MRARSLLSLFSLLALCGCGAGSAERPNLLIVLLDTTRADHLSCYGYEKRTSPVLDALAAEGVRFDAAYSQSSLTPVSTGSLLTGVHPYRHGVRSLFTVAGQGLDETLVTLPELFQARGYRTAGFVAAAPMGAKHGFGRGFEHYSDDFRQGTPREVLRARRPGVYQRRGEVVADELIDWLDGVEDEPFFALLHMFDAHDWSFVPPRAFLAEHTELVLPFELDRTQQLQGLRTNADKRALYDAEITYMDVQVGRVLDALERQGRREDTYVLVLADHGEGLGQHDFWTHGLLWGEQLRVPLLLSGPELPAERVVAERARVVDVLPTLAELFDLSLGENLLDGQSLLPLVEGESEGAEPRELYAEVHHAPEDNLRRDPEMYTLTVGPWKYVHRPSVGTHELYQLEEDPLELDNRYAPDDVMVRYLQARLHEMGAISGGGASLSELSESELEALRNLGYL